MVEIIMETKELPAKLAEKIGTDTFVARIFSNELRLVPITKPGDDQSPGLRTKKSQAEIEKDLQWWREFDEMVRNDDSEDLDESLFERSKITRELFVFDDDEE